MMQICSLVYVKNYSLLQTGFVLMVHTAFLVIFFSGKSLKLLSPKCTKLDFGWGSGPDPAGGAYGTPQSP